MRKIMARQSISGAADDSQDEIDLGQLIETLWIGKWLIALWIVLGTSFGVFVFLTTPKVYQADALVQLESKSSQMGLPTELLGLSDTGAQTTTEIEIIGSRLVLGQAVAKLHLDWQATPVLMPIIGPAVQNYGVPIPGFPSYARPDTSISLDLLQVPATWVEQPIALSITGPGSFRVTLPDDEVLDGQVGVPLNNADKTFALRVATLTGAVGRAFVVMQRDEAKTITAVRQALTIAEQGRGSGVLQLQYKSGNPTEAERVLNAIAESYVKQNIDRGVANADSGLQFLETQLPIAEKAVRDAERELNDYRRQAQVVDLSFESQSLLTQVDKINTELQALQAQEDEIKQRYTPNHPVYQQLLNNRARLQAQLDQLHKETETLPETQRNILNMTNRLELAQKVYTDLQSQAQSTRVMRASNIGSVRIIDLAQATDRAVAPRGSLILALSFVLGGMVGVGNVLVQKWLRRGVQGAEQIEQLGLPVFATVNYVPGADMSRSQKSDHHPILAITDPSSLAIEAFRSLRTSLHFGMLDAKTKSIVMTSSAPSVGKSFTASNLAVVMAQGGQRVCLIDADMRRGHLRKFFNQPKNTSGLAQYLAEEKSLEEVMQKGPVDGLFFIGSGRFPPNPAELLMRPRMAELLALLDKDFDLILLDCPPVLAVTDPAVLGRIAGGTLIVARYGVTQVGEIEATQRTLEGAGVKITGAVLNGYDPRSNTGYRYRYNYNYRYDYKSKSE
jgi:tyrosine-protein kinase Etk/Wzc